MAFTELFKRFWWKAHGLAYSKTRSKEVTEELVQELFTTLWDNRKSLKIENFNAYLLISIRNKSLNFIRSKIVEQKYWNYYKEFIPKWEDTTERTLDYNTLMDAIEVGLKDLPQKTKKVFLLNRIEGRSVSEIASILNLSEKTIGYHLTQSLKRMRVHLKDFTTLLIAAVSIFLK